MRRLFGKPRRGAVRTPRPYLRDGDAPPVGNLFFALACCLFWMCSLFAAPRPPWTSNRVVGSPNPPSTYTVERLFPKLTFRNPVDLVLLPGTDRLFLWSKAANSIRSQASSEVERAELVFDFRRIHQPFDASYAIAFIRAFARTDFSSSAMSNRVVARMVLTFRDSKLIRPIRRPSNRAAKSHHSLVSVAVTMVAHSRSGTTVSFTSRPATPRARSTGHTLQNRTGHQRLLACILRIDVDRTDGTNAYAIPRAIRSSSERARPESMRSACAIHGA
jgi:hypothetical protein